MLDCYANTHLFIRDTAFRSLQTELKSLGLSVFRGELIRDAPPSGKSVEEICSSLAKTNPSLIVVSRAWDEALLETLRHATAGKAKLVRYSHGPPTRLDPSFDAVLDNAGIRALLTDQELQDTRPQSPHWRQSKAAMATAIPITAPEAAEELPTISGPARGCPFLVDVRTSPAFHDSNIDFDQVQSKGCSFCLDNVGAFATFPDKEIVGSWLSQLRTVRAQRPDTRAILLTDERPHPYLPALFREILADPDLHRIEVMIKTRVDWLAEFADNAIEETCTLAEQSASLLHIYLVGFESFHQADLDLFNKAVNVADNVRAIEILHDLESRHPRSFEFRKNRAHGIVLFHPWTTTESLLDNARTMRQVRFEELRTQTLRTRLRLYASVPLHALAERQGLLASQFDEGRSDRAVEQGYDASIPWRFADPAIEAIFRAANAIAARHPKLPEADVLEMVTRFVVRWPAFASHPDLTAPPILHALRTWGNSIEDVIAITGAEVAGYDREVEAVAAGMKQACLKESVAAADANGLVEAYTIMGLAAEVVSHHDRGRADGRHLPGQSHAIIAVAHNSETLRCVLSRQRAVERGEAEHITAMGELMGYPACCTEFFKAQRNQGDNQNLELAPFHAAPENPLRPLLNRFGAVSLISHMLCSPDCSESEKLAAQRLAAIGEIDGDARQRIVDHLTEDVLRLDYQRAATLRGTWDSNRYLVDAIRPLGTTHLSADASQIAALRFDETGIALQLTNGEIRQLQTANPILVEPGKPLASAQSATLKSLGWSKPADSDTSPQSSTNVEHPPPPAAIDSVVDLLNQQQQINGFNIAGIQVDGAGGCILNLRQTDTTQDVSIRPWTPQTPGMSRRGKWALDLVPQRTPSDKDRALVGALARILPAGTRNSDPSDPNYETKRAASSKETANAGDRGVLCTAPWTTLEIVDPDGLVRQCCADWTAGDRGSLHNSTLAAVWNGSGYRRARRIMCGNDVSALCHTICPRLHDFKFAERELDIIPGTEIFVRNQEMLLEDVANRCEETRAKPLYVAICPSTYCNYDCIMCLHGRTPRRELPEAIWAELSDLLPTMRVLTLLGGEPLANPYAMNFLREWDRNKYPDAGVSLITNGSLLTDRALKHLEECQFANITLSLNAGDAETYAKVQRGIDFEQILANLDGIIELRRRQNSKFPIVLSFVVQPANHETLLQFGEIARVRGLPIRLMPLSPEGVEELDFYGDPDQVAQVLASLDEMEQWSKREAPNYLGEIRGTRKATFGKGAQQSSHQQTGARQTQPAS